MTKEALLAAVNAVRTLSGLQVLDLRESALTDAIAAEPLRRLLQNNTTLTALLLGHNELSTLSAKALLAHIGTSKELVELDVESNPGLRWPGQAKEYARDPPHTATPPPPLVLPTCASLPLFSRSCAVHELSRTSATRCDGLLPWPLSRHDVPWGAGTRSCCGRTCAFIRSRLR